MNMLLRRQRREQSPQPYWKQRGWLVSAAFMAFVVLGAALSFTGEDEPEEQKTRMSSVEQVRQKACPETKSSEAMPTAAPKDVKWQKVGLTMVPTSASAGPMTVDGPSWSCYARSPMGSVMAAHGTLSHLSGDNWRGVVENHIVPGPGRKAFTMARSAVERTDLAGRKPGSYVGFTVPEYTADAATVELLIRQPGGGLVATTVSTRWMDGDWKIAPRADGSLYEPLRSVTTPAEHIMWRK
ncbi:hypothetical protein FKR81_41040 [Lentzea tibetensis]|uniref:DUF8175 domain-containing protein n=1 Tax=Lentzea tibetensis TaxID=2591470 RepID=A0A563EFE7_9PSEU|nr:hypothetical protein [Lentzea tibetensis]TWP44513.1 hypothetical protein FKR81_41040 [Lentzea tibetensis]